MGCTVSTAPDAFNHPRHGIADIDPPDVRRYLGPVPHDTGYYAKCMLGGILACGITHAGITPLDVTKCNMQVCTFLLCTFLWH